MKRDAKADSVTPAFLDRAASGCPIVKSMTSNAVTSQHRDASDTMGVLPTRPRRAAKTPDSAQIIY
jgi:hypothetical protein